MPLYVNVILSDILHKFNSWESTTAIYKKKRTEIKKNVRFTSGCKESNQEKKSKNMTPYNCCGYMWLGVQSALEKNDYKDQTRLAVSTNADKEINNLLHETPMFSAFCEDTYSRISLLLSGFHCNMPRDMPTGYLSYLPQEHVVIAWCGSKCVKIALLDLVILVSQARFKL